jgi:hypothetical protein
VNGAEIRKFVFTPADALGVIVNVAVDSAESETGPIGFAASTVQPSGTVSATCRPAACRSPT